MLCVGTLLQHYCNTIHLFCFLHFESIPLCFSGNKFFALFPTLWYINPPEEEGTKGSATEISATYNSAHCTKAYRANKNAKGIESLFPDAVIIAEETRAL